MAGNEEKQGNIVVKKVKKVSGGGHHGGAWKVAYADFVTAMMAFFMLLWLLNVSEKETLDGLADYFTPTLTATPSKSGAMGVLGGETVSEAEMQSSGATALEIPAQPTESRPEQEYDSTINELTDPKLVAAGEEIRQSIQKSPELSEHNDQLIIEQTPEGMRIQIVDKDRRPMFRAGSPELYSYARRMISEIGGIVDDLPNRVAVIGHTGNNNPVGDANYTNWELSADRANAARRILKGSGVSQDRFSEVVGKAQTEPLYPDQPVRPENRRITILVLREAPVIAPKFRRD